MSVPINRTPKQQLFDVVTEVHSEFDSYIILHNDIFKNQASVLSLVKRLFGSRIPFAENYVRCSAARERWSDLNRSVHAVVADIWEDLNREEQMLAIALREYVKTLEATLYTLEVRQKALYLKAETGSSLSLENFRTLEREYKKAVAEYRRIGEEVDRLYASLGKPE